MCRVLIVSRAGFYKWLAKTETQRERSRKRLDALIRVEFLRSKERSGSHQVTEALRKNGERVHRSHVAMRMKELGLRSKVAKKFRETTHSKHQEPVAANILNRQFNVSAPDQVYVSDITYLWTRTGWVYLTVVLDLFSRMVVGWAVSQSLSHEAVLKALWRAVGRRRPSPGTLFHSDRGIQYACKMFRKTLSDLRFVQSMSRKGNCWDNAVAESFFRTLKTEWYYGNSLHDINQVETELFEYIERYYNCQRLHSTLGYCSPREFEMLMNKKCA